jgi:hypothetical protein
MKVAIITSQHSGGFEEPFQQATIQGANAKDRYILGYAVLKEGWKLSIDAEREGGVHPGRQVLVEVHVSFFLLFVVIVVADIGVAIPLDVFPLAFSLQDLELLHLSGDGLL